MDLLLDTHSLIWFLNGDYKLSDKAKTMIESPKNTKLSQSFRKYMQLPIAGFFSFAELPLVVCLSKRTEVEAALLVT
jgi:hypothetical protein